MKLQSGAVVLMLLTPAAVLASDPAGRAKLPGTWQESGKAGSVWVLEEKSGAMHITGSEGDRKLADFECNTVGRDCELKEAGKKAKVSMWYNGPRLVELETRGSEVLQRTFGIVDENTLEVEVVQIVPEGKPETLHFKRTQPAAPGTN